MELTLQPQFHVGFRIVMISSEAMNEFSCLFDGIGPVLSIIDRNVTCSLVGNCTLGPASDPVPDHVTQKHCPDDIPETAFRALVQNIYSIAKDQLNDAKMLAAFVARILPTFRQVALAKNSILVHFVSFKDLVVPWTDATRLYQTSLKPVAALVNGESLRSIYTSQSTSLLDEDRVNALIVGSFLSKHDGTVSAAGRIHSGT